MAPEKIVYPRLSPGQKSALSKLIVEKIGFKVSPNQTPGLTPELVFAALEGKVILTRRYAHLVRQVLRKSHVVDSGLDRKPLAIFATSPPSGEPTAVIAASPEPAVPELVDPVPPIRIRAARGTHVAPSGPRGPMSMAEAEVYRRENRIEYLDYRPPTPVWRMALYGLFGAGILVFDLYLVQQLIAGGPWALYIGFLVAINAIVGLVVTS